MKREKPLIALIISLVLVAAAALAATPRAIWVWEEDTLRILDDAEARREATEFFLNRSISTVYLYADAFRNRNPVVSERPKLGAAIARFHRAGLRVYALLGSIHLHTEQYLLPAKRGAAERMLGNVLDYNAIATATERFDGVNLDIEPYILANWAENRAELAVRYLDLCDLYVQMRNASAPGLILGPAIPFWFDGIPIAWKGTTAPLSEHVQQLFDYVAIMDYRDKAEGRDGIIRHAENEIAFADRIGRKVVIGLETLETTPPKVTFYEEGADVMAGELRKVRDALRSRPSFGGFAIHHYATFRALPAKPRGGTAPD